MHIFQREVNQSLIIGHDMVVTVLEIQPTYVRLGITDPHTVPAYREETLYLPEAEGHPDWETEHFDAAEFACVTF